LDLKPSNVFVHDTDLRDELEILIGDFGCATILTENQILSGEGIGIPCYMAPERFKNTEKNKVEAGDRDLIQAHVLSTKGDIWSCGMILYELLSNEHSLIFQYNDSDGDHEIFINIQSFTGTEAQFKTNLYKLSDHALAASLIRAALEVDPSSRPTAEQMLAQPFLMLLDVVFMILREIHEELNPCR
jgi:serine/threonine protein kinase